MKGVPKDKQLILFDGVCNLCNSSVLYVIKRDKKNLFLFAPLQSNIGEQIINEFNIDTTETDSIILYNPSEQKIYSKSTAALKVAKLLSYPTKLLSGFLIVPASIRNWVYDFIAKNRYKWYGKKESCMIPTPELKAKFLD
ncbi:thiol-disulfide oxidoreductase DCC family protein [Winogradskyella litorisediminis]|uniref:Thiol-disulfide oxidoreductase DCC family protein n=1 Tax=Winogradskyella litorisediminis TaxID=1156618 RepID=A0ABW3N4K7_9FLAO